MSDVAKAAPQFIRRRVLHIVFASTSGHTEYVVEALIDSLKSITPGWEIEVTMAEKTQPQDLLGGDVLLLASSTWNTGSIEGQLNPHMWVLLHEKAKTLDLAGKPYACIGLGDHRYFYTVRAVDHLQPYVKAHHGRLIVPTLKIIDQPYEFLNRDEFAQDCALQRRVINEPEPAPAGAACNSPQRSNRDEALRKARSVPATGQRPNPETPFGTVDAQGDAQRARLARPAERLGRRII